jgi:hypothetical protein
LRTLEERIEDLEEEVERLILVWVQVSTLLQQTADAAAVSEEHKTVDKALLDGGEG